MRKHKNKIIAVTVIACVLAFVYWWGGNSPELRGWEIKSETSSDTFEDISENNETAVKENNETAEDENETQNSDSEFITAQTNAQTAKKVNDASADVNRGDISYSKENGMEIDDETGKDKYQTSPVPDGKPVPTDDENIVISDKEMTCNLSVRCDTILNNIAWLDKEKIELVPKDGIIFAEQSVTFYEGESVFNLLVREMKKNKIHLEFVNTPVYNSAYIEGIANLYEFDCGELSGWMYKVNGWFPNYGCSRYRLKAGDKVEWVYTCNLGGDVGDVEYTRNGLDKNE